MLCCHRSRSSLDEEQRQQQTPQSQKPPQQQDAPEEHLQVKTIEQPLDVATPPSTISEKEDESMNTVEEEEEEESCNSSSGSAFRGTGKNSYEEKKEQDDTSTTTPTRRSSRGPAPPRRHSYNNLQKRLVLTRSSTTGTSTTSSSTSFGSSTTPRSLEPPALRRRRSGGSSQSLLRGSSHSASLRVSTSLHQPRRRSGGAGAGGFSSGDDSSEADHQSIGGCSSSCWSAGASTSYSVLPPRSSSVSSALVSASIRNPESSTHQSSTHAQQVLRELTIDKLQFDRVGLIGRQKELDEIQRLFQLTMGTKTKTEREQETRNRTSDVSSSLLHDKEQEAPAQQPCQSPRHCSLLLVGGSAGTGKSQLAMHALQPLLGHSCPHQAHLRSHHHDNDDQHQHTKFLGLGKGLLLRGKHEQPLSVQAHDPQFSEATTNASSTSKPYSAIAMCCQDLCQTLIGQLPPDQIQELRQKLQTTLGPDAATLTHVLPALLPLVGLVAAEEENEKGKEGMTNSHWRGSMSSIDITDNGTTTAVTSGAGCYLGAQRQFQQTVRRFWRVICDLAPTVLLLEDLQWCDDSSFRLLESLLKDTKNDRLLIVGTYRALPAENNRLLQFQQECQTAAAPSGSDKAHCVTVQTMELGNLSLESTLQWLVELLSTSPEATRPLAECVYAKTLGNAYFTHEFLTTLQKSHLLTFNLGTLAWQWNVEHIQQQTEATDNVADLVRTRLQTLPIKLQRTLPWIASLGSFFNVDLFHMVMVHLRRQSYDGKATTTASSLSLSSTCSTSSSDSDTDSEMDHPNDHQTVLDACVDEGLIELRGPGTYHWIHDKVEEAALQLVSEEELETMQFELASSFLQQMDEHQKKENIFILVYLYRTGSERLAPNDPQRRMLAQLHLECGLQAFCASAFEQAAVELDIGMELLSTLPDAWQTDYELCLELFSTAAEAHLCIGNLDQVDHYVMDILENTEDKPIVDRKRAYNAQVRAYIANAQLSDATELLLQVLAELGIKFRKGGAIVAILTKLLHARKNVDENTDAVSKLPPMVDEIKVWSIFLLDRLMTCWYQSKSPMLPLAPLTALEIILKNGICNFAANHVTTTGLLVSVGLHDAKAGCMYAQQALQIVDDVSFPYCKAQPYFSAYHFVLHQTLPVEETKKGLLKGYHSGIAHGDSEFACWCMYSYLEHTLISGSMLEPMVRDCRASHRESGDLQQFSQGFLTLLVWQYSLNMMGQSKDPLVLTGEAMTEERWLEQNILGHHWEMLLGRYKMHAAVIMGAYDRAMEIILQYGFHENKYKKGFPGAFSNYVIVFHVAIATLSMVRQCRRSRSFLKLATKLGRELNALSEAGNPNVQHYAALVSAELADLQGQSVRANELFQRSILLAARRGFRHDRALAHERFGDFHLRQLDVTSAQYQYREALRSYEEWGGRAKVEQLQRAHPELLQPQSGP